MERIRGDLRELEGIGRNWRELKKLEGVECNLSELDGIGRDCCLYLLYKKVPYFVVHDSKYLYDILGFPLE